MSKLKPKFNTYRCLDLYVQCDCDLHVFATRIKIGKDHSVMIPFLKWKIQPDNKKISVGYSTGVTLDLSITLLELASKFLFQFQKIFIV